MINDNFISRVHLGIPQNKTKRKEKKKKWVHLSTFEEQRTPDVPCELFLWRMKSSFSTPLGNVNFTGSQKSKISHHQNLYFSCSLLCPKQQSRKSCAISFPWHTQRSPELSRHGPDYNSSSWIKAPRFQLIWLRPVHLH